MKNKKTIIITISVIAIILVSVIAIILVKNNIFSKDDGDNNNEIQLIIGDDTVTDYYINEEFVYPKVYVMYKDERVVDITNSERLTVNGFNLSKSGVQTVKIQYFEGDLSAQYEYKIYIYPAVLTSITATYSESEILWGQKIDKEKLTVIAKYSNLTEKQIFDYQLKYNSTPESYGPNTATVTYKEFSASFTLNVIEKEVDDEYVSIEDEAKILLTKLGKTNPTCPKDYEFIKDAYGEGYIRATGTIEEYAEKSTNALYAFLKSSVFEGYTLTDGPVSSTEVVFPSKKLVFDNESLGINATIHIITSSENLQYLLFISFTG